MNTKKATVVTDGEGRTVRIAAQRPRVEGVPAFLQVSQEHRVVDMPQSVDIPPPHADLVLKDRAHKHTWGLAALVGYCLQSYLIFTGTALRPPRAARRSLLRPVRDPWTWARTVGRGREVIPRLYFKRGGSNDRGHLWQCRTP